MMKLCLGYDQIDRKQTILALYSFFKTVLPETKPRI